MAIPFVNTTLKAIWLQVNNKETFGPLFSFLDDMATNPTPTTLLVGDTTDGYYDYDDDYAGPGRESWLSVDGIHPPTVPLLRMPDQVTGLMYLLTIENGTPTATRDN